MIANVKTTELSFLVAEVGAAILVVLVAFAVPHSMDRLSILASGWLGRIARRPIAAIALVGISAPLIRLSLLPVAPIPQPERHDEFSHLLAADTFASGRLTNPTHPMWPHFETFHENQQPSYMSMYPPLQGLVLAFGKVAFGHPWYGVVMSVGMMCAAIHWMLQGWLPPVWALFGATLAVLRIGIFSYWMNSYWGGAVPAIGGALLLGALPRLMRRPGRATALTASLGLAILANSRPFEGMLLAIPVGATLLVWAARDRQRWQLLATRIAVPALVCLTITGGLMAYYDWRVYGDPLTLPYQVNRATYAVAPVFVWETPRPEPAYRHAVMRAFYTGWELQVFQKARSLPGFAAAAATKVGMMVYFYWGGLLLLPLLLMFRRVVFARRLLPLLIAAAFFLLGEFANAFSVPHYVSPITALLFAVIVQGMRHLRLWRPGGQPAGRCLVALVPTALVGLCVLHVVMAPLGSITGLDRAAVQQRLSAGPGRHLAIVRYAPEHHPLSLEWVYNSADIDGAPVVWAREMSPAEDRKLIDYFKDRNVWLVEPDSVPPKVSPYVCR
jgi:hypothetical protein